ncbi:MAG TPA: DUF1588 domain-containing protein [Polyangiaceae bacterium]|nr:DUF1588 domain-containing protein [Polyangiaceae bacterium]
MKLCCVGIGLGLLTFACSGRYDVGFEPAGGSAGKASQNAAGTAASSGGSSSVGGTGSGTAGGSVIGEGGVGDNDVPVDMGRCGFSPTAKSAPATAVASSAELATRVYHFLDASEAPSDLMLPRTPSAAWAATLATQILDGHAAAQTEAPGLVRFLASWLPGNADHPTADSAHAWGLKLTAADATLATLLSEPTGEAHRFGILTEVDVLSAKNGISARGTWMVKALFCTDVPPPPPNLPEADPAPQPGMTQREVLEASVANPACNACHALFDPSGDSLEHFDDAGNYRVLDNGEPVDASARMASPPLEFQDFESLAPQLAVSCQVAQCIGGSIFQDALNAGLGSGAVTLSESERNAVANQFANADFSIRALVQAIVTSPSFVR